MPVVGDVVKCRVRKIGEFHRIGNEGEVMEFQIINRFKVAGYYYYSVLVEDDFAGWMVNRFHIEHSGVAKAFLHKKFFDISDNEIL